MVVLKPYESLWLQEVNHFYGTGSIRRHERLSHGETILLHVEEDVQSPWLPGSSVILPVNGLVSFPSHHVRLLKIWS